MTDDLIARLRSVDVSWSETGEWCAEAADRIEAIEAENERLRETVDAVWKEATTMRNASKLVGPYPTEPSKHRVWVRSMYHAGKKLHELMKPIRALKGSQQ